VTGGRREERDLAPERGPLGGEKESGENVSREKKGSADDIKFPVSTQGHRVRQGMEFRSLGKRGGPPKKKEDNEMG